MPVMPSSGPALIHVHQAQQFAHRLRHGTPTFIAGTAALRHADAAPKFVLIHANAVSNLPRIDELVGFHFDVRSLHIEYAALTSRLSLCPTSIGQVPQTPVRPRT